MQYTISMILTSILVLSLLEFYLEYIHPHKLRYNQFLLLLGYIALFLCSFFFADLPYIITPIIIVAVLFSKQYKNTTFSVLIVICYALQYFLVTKCDGQTIIYSILIGLMAAFCGDIVNKAAQQIIYVISMVFYGCTVILVLDFYFLNNIYLEHLLYGAGTILASYLIGIGLSELLNRFFSVVDRLLYESYLSPEEELNSILMKMRPDLYSIGDCSRKLAISSAKALSLPIYKCGVGTLLYPIAMLSKEEYLKNGLSLVHQYHLPKIVKRSIMMFFQTGTKPKDEIEGVIYLAGLTGAALEYNKKQTTRRLTTERIIQNVWIKQIKNHTLSDTGFDGDALSLLYNIFLEELNKETDHDNSSNK